MKKLSKILVIVLTLAMLLGVVVVSASASDKKVDVLGPDGSVIASTDSLDEALTTANGNTTAGDITVKLNQSVTLTKAVTITRDKNLGKVIIDLNGKTMTLSVSNSYQAYAYAAGGASTATVYDTVWVKIADAEPTLYFLKGLTLANATLDGKAVGTYEAGKTYVADAVSAGTAVQTVTLYKGDINIGAGASLEVSGNGGSVAYSNAHAFYIDDGQDGAELLLRNFSVTSTSATYLLQTNSGTATLDGLSITRNSAASILRHASDSEINIKNCYITNNAGANANMALIFTEGTNLEKAADDYHIEIENTTVITSLPFIAGSHPAITSCGVKASAKFDSKNMYSAEQVRVSGVDYENTSMLIKNCNIEQVNYRKADKRRTDSWSLIQSGANFNIDFEKCNLFAAQWLVNSERSALKTSTLNFTDCYIELTGKGNLGSSYEAAIAYGAAGTVLNFYSSEIRIGTLLKDSGKIPGTETLATPAHYLKNHDALNFYAGCIFDGACAPLEDSLKASIKSGTYLTKTDENGNVTEMFVTGFDSEASKLFADEITHYFNNTAEDIDPSKTSTNTRTPIVVLAGGNKLTDAGADTTSRQFFTSMSSAGYQVNNMPQGIQKVGVEEDGNKYVYYDPSYVKNDMTGYNYTEASAFSDDVQNALPAGVTAVGGWDIDGDSVLEYLNTDNNAADAEYANIATNASKSYDWVVIPDAYDKNYTLGTSSAPWFLINDGSNYLYAPEYEYITYSFDYKNADDSDYFFPILFNVQARREFGVSKDSGTRKLEIKSNGDVYIGEEYKKTLEKGTWSNITILVELIADDTVGTGNGHYINETARGNVSYADSVAHVFINGEKVGTFATGWNAEHGWVSGLRGIFPKDDTAWAGGAKMCIDNVETVGYKKDYQSDQLDALISGEETDIYTWSDSILALHKNNEVKAFPEEKAPAAKIEWTPTSHASYTEATADVVRLEDAVSNTVIYFDSVEDAIAHSGTKLTVKLLADAEKVLVNAPATIDTNGNEFTYYSNEYKGTLDSETGILSFTRADASELVEVSYGYGDEIITETFVNGGYFWLDTDRIPTLIKDFDVKNATDVQLAYNGTLLEAINPADYAAAQVISEGNNSFVFSYEIIKQYGWIILDRAGNFSELPVDIGDTYDELALRIEAIEKPLDFSKVDVDLVTDESGNVVLIDGKPTLVDAYNFDENTAKLRTAGYTIKFFSDFEAAKRFYVISYGAGKIVDYDLNGHTVTYSGGAIFAFGAEMGHEYDPSGHIVQVHGTYIENGMPTTWSTTKVQDATNKVYAFLSDNALTVNIISSTPGAKMISSSATPLISAGRQEKLYYNDNSGTQQTIVSNFAVPQINLGNALSSSHTAIGPDANVIDIEAPFIYYMAAYKGVGSVRNVNVYAGNSAGILEASGGTTNITNCNFTYTNASGKGVLLLGGGTQKFEMTKCNIISNNVVKLFNHAGNRGETASNYASISDSRLYNVNLDGTTISFNKTGPVTDRRAFLTAGCYYNIEYTPNDKVTLRPDVSTTTQLIEGTTLYAPYYTANVYANETVKINGVYYTFTYKVVADDDIVDVIWQSPDGSITISEDKYVSGAKLVYDKAAVVYDAITKTEYAFAENLGNATLGEGEEIKIVKALALKYVPSFTVETNVTLSTALKHNIKIYKYVYDEANAEYIDVIDYIIGDVVTVGGKTFALAEENLNKGADAENPYDDYYYYTVDVKSNAMAGTYDLVINFKTILDSKDVTATQTLSVAKYLADGLANLKADSELYNLYVSVVNYGIAAYNYFADTAVGELSILTALAEKYPVKAPEKPEATGATGDNLDVEFVLDEKLEYRFYLVGIASDYQKFNNLFITYTNINGETNTYSTVKGELKIESYGENYWVDFELPAYECAAEMTVMLYNNMAGVDYTTTYNIATYCAEAAGSSEELNSLAEALYAYAFYANAYESAN